MDYSWSAILAALGITLTAVMSLIPTLNFIATRWDARKARLKSRKEQEISQSTGFKTLELDNRKHEESVWKEIAAERKVDLATALEEIKNLRKDVARCRTRLDAITSAYKHALDDIEYEMRKLKVVHVEKEVVDILDNKIFRVLNSIEEARKKFTGDS